MHVRGLRATTRNFGFEELFFFNTLLVLSFAYKNGIDSRFFDAQRIYTYITL